MTDPDTQPDLIELISSRLAHELVGPIGAISNGLELMTELGEEAGDDVQQLISGSAEAAGARLAFYRLAYGRAGFGVTNAAQLRAVATPFFAQMPRHDLSWPLPPVLPSLPDGAGRLILLLCELAVDMAPRGGLVSVSLDDDAATVTATDDGATPHEGITAILEAPGASLSPSADTAHAALARSYAEKIGWHISVVPGDGNVRLQAKLN